MAKASEETGNYFRSKSLEEFGWEWKELEEGWCYGLSGEKWAPVNTRRIQGEQTFLVMSCRIQKSGELSYLT